MEKVYNPSLIEEKYYSLWEKNGCFEPKKLNGHSPAYCIMLPPPNITGSLHMGHAFQHTLMDILIRYHKMCGKNTLWQPGTDHAGIATQMVVERKLEAEGKTQDELGRKEFIQEIWKWKTHSGGQITAQMRRLGNSLAWQKEVFTMDEKLSNATQTVFLKLYEDDLIYRGKRLVNWDIKFQTAVSDLEVVNRSEQGKLYHISYPLVETKNTLVVATTRPETLLGDVAIAVHPDDVRFQSFIGKKAKVPLTDRLIPIIADDYVDPTFGSGCVKITPAHDFNDYQVGKRHQLSPLNILNFDGTLNENVPKPYQGIDRLVAREKIVEDLSKQNLLLKVEPHELSRPYGDRSNTIIEPMLTDQWFVRVAPLAKKAIEVVQSGKIQFFPAQWEKVYFQWMNSLEDWCISRQIWWGHRIPIWYDEKGNMFAAKNEKSAQLLAQKYHQTTHLIPLKQDEDVLDTWFSSALWPFSTLGWPENNMPLKTYYPTSVLVTGFDIIFFWVARMIMMGLYCQNDVPFRQIYITGLIRDHRGQKMSKSKGNVIDPIDLIDGISLEDLIQKRTANLMQTSFKQSIEKTTRSDYPQGIEGFGADALRFSLMAEAGSGRDINFDVNQIRGYRNFCNKIWNAARFSHMQLEDREIAKGYTDDLLGVFDQWILKRLNDVIKTSHAYLATYRFDQLASVFYDFIWHDFCDWYLEVFKIHSEHHQEGIQFSRRVLLDALESILRLMHPVTPFLTEQIWQSLKVFSKKDKDFLIECSYPTAMHDSKNNAQHACEIVDQIQSIVKETRQLRIGLGISPNQSFTKAQLFDQSLNESHQFLTKKLAKIDQFSSENTSGNWVNTSFGMVLLDGAFDVKKHLLKLDQLVEQKQKYLLKQKQKISNERFKQSAPKKIIQRENELYERVQKEVDHLKKQKMTLNGF